MFSFIFDISIICQYLSTFFEHYRYDLNLSKEMQVVDEMLFYQQIRMMPQKYETLLALEAPRNTKVGKYSV